MLDLIFAACCTVQICVLVGCRILLLLSCLFIRCHARVQASIINRILSYFVRQLSAMAWKRTPGILRTHAYSRTTQSIYILLIQFLSVLRNFLPRRVIVSFRVHGTTVLYMPPSFQPRPPPLKWSGIYTLES